MANKVHPLIVPNSIHESPPAAASATTTCSSNKYVTSKRETFTIWMKSLVMQGNGCTAFDQHGEIVYRIDNYDNKHSNEVYLMDARGKLLFTVCEKKVCVVPTWKCCNSSDVVNHKKSFFQVTKSCRSILGNKDCYKVSTGSCDDSHELQVLGLKSPSEFVIRDKKGGVVAEAKRKQSSSGVVLGDDVFTLMVEPHVDHSFIMALVTVYGLIRHQI